MTELPPGAGALHTIVPGTTLREWEVVRFVGRGSYGMVFEAERSSWLHEPHRALKVFDPIVSGAARSALLAEFAALTGVRHPHLLAGIDAFDLTEPPYAGCVVFVLELADEDLSHRIARAGRVPPDEVAAIGVQVADGLTALHGAGRIHGDVKPENILRVGDRWALGDFGVTGLLEGSYAITTGATIDYRPPELATAAEGTRLHRSADVWALGVTLHVAATGQHPFRGPDPIMRYAAAVRGDRLLAPAIDPALAAVVDGACLTADPSTRADAPTLADHLRLWPSVPPPLALPPGPAPGVPGQGPAPPPAGAPRPLVAPGASPEAPGDLAPPSPVRPAPSPVEASPDAVVPSPAPPSVVGAPPVVGPAVTPMGAAGLVPVGAHPPGAEPPPAPSLTPPPHAPPTGAQDPAAPAAPGAPAPAAPVPAAPGARGPDAPGARIPAAPPAPALAGSTRPAGRLAGWWALGVVGLATLVVTQVVAIVVGEVVDGLGARRIAYAVVSLAVVGALVAVAAVLERREPHERRKRPSVAVAAVAGATWLVATVALFLR